MQKDGSIQLDSNTEDNVNKWLSDEYDAETQLAVQKMLKENPKEIADAFYTQLKFGTGGLRGIMGIGCNRMNRYTVGTATQGLANYINQQPKPIKGHSVFIGYDSRHHSREFAEVSAKILAGNGIEVYLFEDIRPTPLVSFGCRYKKCSAAIVITASHNPPEYNGYKVYWEDGSQLLPPHDRNVITEVKKISGPSQVKSVDALIHPLIHIIGSEVDEAYLNAITPLQNYPEINKSHGNTLQIVYTNIHGSGIKIVPQALRQWGFDTIRFVERQIIADGNFPTVRSPNPEEAAALKMGIEIMLKHCADLLIGTDPDADRVGAAVRHHGEALLLNGNQIACICLQHICEAQSSRNRLDERAAFVKSIVTTELFQVICDAYKRPCYNVLPGFKYYGEKIRIWEQEPDGPIFIFGGEESYGYLYGTQTRDKDAAIGAVLLCEAALKAKLQGLTLIDQLEKIYRTYGYYFDKLMQIQFGESKSERENMEKSMESLLENPPKNIQGIAVHAIEDYKRSVKTYIQTGRTEPIALPKSDVLAFRLEDGSKLTIRPSGTEPKIKIYCEVMDKQFDNLQIAQNRAAKHADTLLKALRDSLFKP